MLNACYQGHSSPQVVSAPSAGVPAARLRVAMEARSSEGFPEFIPSTSRVSARRHRFDESPALTAVLQAQPPGIVAGRAAAAKLRMCKGAGWTREGLLQRALEPVDFPGCGGGRQMRLVAHLSGATKVQGGTGGG